MVWNVLDVVAGASVIGTFFPLLVDELLVELAALADGSSPNSFSKSSIDWKELDTGGGSILAVIELSQVLYKVSGGMETEVDWRLS